MNVSQIELFELGEAIRGNEACLEKAAMMAAQCEDNDVRNMVERTQRMLQQHHDELLRLVSEATVAEGRAGETRRSATQQAQAPGYTAPGWSGPSYGGAHGETGFERNEGGAYYGNIRT